MFVKSKKEVGLGGREMRKRVGMGMGMGMGMKMRIELFRSEGKKSRLTLEIMRIAKERDTLGRKGGERSNGMTFETNNTVIISNSRMMLFMTIATWTRLPCDARRRTCESRPTLNPSIHQHFKSSL